MRRAARPSLDAARASRSLPGGQATITQALPVTAFYYAPVVPNQYDVVLTSTVTGPGIRHSCSLMVRYLTRLPRAYVRNHHLLNSAGDSKPVPLDQPAASVASCMYPVGRPSK